MLLYKALPAFFFFFFNILTVFFLLNFEANTTKTNMLNYNFNKITKLIISYKSIYTVYE